jgi:hypothetical protein
MEGGAVGHNFEGIFVFFIVQMNNQNSRSLGMAIMNKLRDMGFRT